MANHNRTYYRELRIKLLREMIDKLITVLTLSTTKIEKIPVDDLRNLKKDIENTLIQAGKR